VTAENIYETQHPRNPRLMDAMFYLRFVRCAREGTRRMRDTMVNLGLPKPEFAQKESNYASVRVTLRNDIKHRKLYIDKVASAVIGEAIFKRLSDDEKRVINFVAEHGDVSVSQVQRLTQKSWPASKKLLIKLTEMRILEHKIKQPQNPDARDTRARFLLRQKD
jgi:ATP-dependent DNA helicase RecG